MSGFVGIFHLGGLRVEDALLPKLASPMAYRGAIRATATKGPLSVQVLSRTNSAVRLAQNNESLIAFDGRLDNADTLAPSSSGDKPDAQVALTEYQHRPGSFPATLVGDFSLALYDATNREVILARDVMGGRTLYFARIGDHLVFASEIKAILQYPDFEPKPDDDVLAEFLFRGADFRNQSSTFFCGINTVPPGHAVRISPAGEISIERYWDFDTGVRGPRTFDEAVERYRDLFLGAVRRRLPDAVSAITVSGGIDSSSIYCAAEYLKKSGEKLPDFYGVGFVSEHKAADEREYIADIEEMYGTRVEQFAFKHEGLLAESADQVWIMESPLLQWNAIHGLYRSAQKHNAARILSGFFGDQLLLSPLFIVDDVLRLRLPSAYEHFREYMRWFGEAAPWRDQFGDLLRETKGFFIPERLRPYYRRLKSKFLSADPSLPFYSERFHQHVAQRERASVPIRMRSASAYAKGILHQVYSRKHAFLMEMDIKLASSYGLDLTHPFRDRDLIHFLLTLPGELTYSGGRSRSIHREAMMGILPESIRLRKSKGDYTFPINEAMRADADSFSRGLKELLGTELGYLAPVPDLKRSLDSLIKGLDQDDSRAVWALGDVMALEEWLKTFFRAKLQEPITLEA